MDVHRRFGLGIGLGVFNVLWRAIVATLTLVIRKGHGGPRGCLRLIDGLIIAGGVFGDAVSERGLLIDTLVGEVLGVREALVFFVGRRRGHCDRLRPVAHGGSLPTGNLELGILLALFLSCPGGGFLGRGVPHRLPCRCGYAPGFFRSPRMAGYRGGRHGDGRLPQTVRPCRVPFARAEPALEQSAK